MVFISPSKVTTPSPSLSAWAMMVSVFRDTSASDWAMWFAFNIRANCSGGIVKQKGLGPQDSNGDDAEREVGIKAFS